MKNTIKRHLISFVVTFIAMFLLALYPAIELGNWESGIFLGAILAAARSAFKLAWEFALVPLFNNALDWAKEYKK